MMLYIDNMCNVYRQGLFLVFSLGSWKTNGLVLDTTLCWHALEGHDPCQDVHDPCKAP